MYTDAPHFLVAGRRRALDVGGRLDVSAPADGVFFVIRHVQLDANSLESIGERRQSTVTDARYLVLVSVDLDDTCEATFEVGVGRRLACARRRG